MGYTLERRGAQWCPLPGGYRTVTCGLDCWRALAAETRLAADRANAQRDAAIRRAVRDGRTVAELAAVYGLTQTRIRQILARPVG